MPGKMALEEWLVDRDVLHANDPLPVFDLENPIDEQKWIAVRQHPHDVFDLEHGRLLRYCLFHGAHQSNGSTMTRSHCRDSRAHARAGQRKIAYTIQRLVPNELVGPTQR